VSGITEIPDALRDGLPEELKSAELAGGHIAGADESCRLYGPPGAGKYTQSAFRAGTLAIEEELQLSDMTVVTYWKALAGVVRNRLIDWGVFEAPDVDPEKADSANPLQYWCTIHAVAARATGFLADVNTQDDDLAGMVGRKAKRRFCSELDIDYLPPRPWLETRWTVFYDLYTYARRTTSSTLASGRTSRVRVCRRSARTRRLTAASTRSERSGGQRRLSRRSPGSGRHSNGRTTSTTSTSS
jgi:DNA helicase-2/ATP-dependent DNA helicase PcrA